MASRPATIECIGPSYLLPDRKSSSMRSINLFVRQIEGLGEGKKVVLESVPGLVEVLDLGDTIRGAYATEDRLFAVAGSTLYELTTLAAVSRGSLLTSSGAVSMAHGRDQLVIVDGRNGYTLRLGSNTFAQIVDSDFRGSNSVAEVNGTFVFVDPTTFKDQFYLSAIDDASDFDALDFSSADAQPDNIVTHRVLKQEVLFFGVTSSEVWVYTGESEFPLSRYNSTPIDVGIVGGRALIEAADTLYFVGQTKSGSGIVFRLEGHQPRAISDAAVEAALQSSTDLSACSMWAFQLGGVEFVGVNAPGLETTRVFNTRTQLWHEQAQLVDGDWQPFPIEFTAFFGGQHYAMSGTKVYRLERESLDIGDDPMTMERTWPHLVAPSLEPINYRELRLQCTTGTGGTVTLEVSNDGGYNFGSPLARSLGTTGRYAHPVRWFPLGSAADRVFRLRTQGAGTGPWVAHNAALEAA